MMRILTRSLEILMVCMLTLATVVSAKSIGEYIGEAEAFRAGGDFDSAVAVMREALKEYPEHPMVMAYLGGYLITQAGQTDDQAKQSTMFFESIGYLDRSVEMDGSNLIARFYRGIASIQAPEFLGRLEQGIADMAMFADGYYKDPGAFPDELLSVALEQLSAGYEKLGDTSSTADVWSEVRLLFPESELARKIEQGLVNEMTSPERIDNTAQRLMAENPAIAALSEQLKADPDNAMLMYQLAMAYSEEADKGYDDRIYDDTTFRTNLAFKIVDLLGRAAQLAPDNMEIRLASGTASVNMPFFVNRLDQGIDDLNAVISGMANEEQKAEAHYWLGYAYQKKATSEWIQIITEYPDTEAADMTFGTITPRVRMFDRANYAGPVVVIDFVLGFQDELAPQTAVWIENEAGGFVRTIYVSGFSGYVKDRQVDLPRWAEASDFVNTDGVTGASINIGSHCYVWNLKDYNGERVTPGLYTVRVETMFWPSMKYQSEAVEITVGHDENSASAEKGHFIPWLKATYYP